MVSVDGYIRCASDRLGIWPELAITELRYVFVFFFFQAEDGIRDWSVTGVQTCALPICGREGSEKWL